MIIELLNGTRYDINNYGVHRLFNRIPSLGVEHITSSVDGANGLVFQDTKYVRDNIVVNLVYLVQDIYDFYLLRDELSKLFARKEHFYIIFKRQPYKRWTVKLASKFDMEPNPKGAPFQIEFVCVDVFAESVGYSTDLEKQDFDSGFWGWGSGVNVDETYKYTHNSNSFIIDNIGDENIIPEEHELEIIIKATGPYLQVRNDTNGDVFIYNKNISTSDTIIINGIRILKNEVSCLRDTNHGLISLEVGKNVFSVTGGTIQNIIFKYRFKYK